MTTDSSIAARRSALARVQDELEALETLGVVALQAKYLTVFNEETRSRNAPYLRRKIAWRLQEIAEGGLSERAKERIAELAVDMPIRHCPPRESSVAMVSEPASEQEERDARLPPVGTILARSHNGVDHRVAVAAGGFVYGGKTYKSLSAVAKAITGTTWNGHTFFASARRIGGNS